MSLKNKRILITAGPTWVAIDKVRVLSNTASGETGIKLANKLIGLGAHVTLLLGPSTACCLDKRIRVVNFRFFDELRNNLFRTLESSRYDAIIHTAAVADYRPESEYPSKISSGLSKLRLNLIPTQKIIDQIKKIDKRAVLVGFKYDPSAAKEILLKKARSLMHKSCSDIVIANTTKKNKYAAYILKEKNVSGPYTTKDKMISVLITQLNKDLA